MSLVWEQKQHFIEEKDILIIYVYCPMQKIGRESYIFNSCLSNYYVQKHAYVQDEMKKFTRLCNSQVDIQI